MRRDDEEPARRGEARADGAAGRDATPPAGPFGQPWLAAACLCLLADAVCLLLGYYDAAFVVAALGAVAWFLNVRSKLPRRPDEDEADEDETPDEDEAAGP